MIYATKTQNNPLPLLISTRDPLLTFCRWRHSRMMSTSGHPTDNTERVHKQLNYAVTQQHYYSQVHATTYEGASERVCVVWMSWTDLSAAEGVHKQE